VITKSLEELTKEVENLKKVNSLDGKTSFNIMQSIGHIEKRLSDIEKSVDELGGDSPPRTCDAQIVLTSMMKSGDIKICTREFAHKGFHGGGGLHWRWA